MEDLMRAAEELKRQDKEQAAAARASKAAWKKKEMAPQPPPSNHHHHQPIRERPVPSIAMASTSSASYSRQTSVDNYGSSKRPPRPPARVAPSGVEPRGISISRPSSPTQSRTYKPPVPRSGTSLGFYTESGAGRSIGHEGFPIIKSSSREQYHHHTSTTAYGSKDIISLYGSRTAGSSSSAPTSRTRRPEAPPDYSDTSYSTGTGSMLKRFFRKYHTLERYHEVSPRGRGVGQGGRAFSHSRGSQQQHPPTGAALKPARSQGRLPSKFDSASSAPLTQIRQRPKSLYFEDDCLVRTYDPMTSSYGGDPAATTTTSQSSSNQHQQPTMRKYKSVVSLSKDNTSSQSSTTVYLRRSRPVVSAAHSANNSPVKRASFHAAAPSSVGRKFNKYDERALLRRLSTSFDDEDDENYEGGRHGDEPNIVLMATSDFYSYSSEDEV